MKIVDAFWEKRNLGVNTVEIIVETNDSPEDLNKLSEELLNYEYVVVKIPANRFEFNEYLATKGYIFIEASFNYQLQVKDAVLTPLQQRLDRSITYAEMDTTDLEQLYEEIKNGLFNTDRIISDKHFNETQAANRYINWIKDELKLGSVVYKLLLKDDSIGFFTFKCIKSDTYYPFLAGLYKRYSNSGLGFATLRKPIEEVIKRNGTKISTYTSSNNIPVNRAHIQQGFTIFETQYVYIKHNNKK